MSKQNDLAQVVQNKTAALYASGNETQIAIFEALQLEKALKRGDGLAAAIGELESLRQMGANLSGGELANAQSRDRAVTSWAVENSIADNLAAAGKSQEEIAATLGVLKQVGALMAGGGVAAGDNRGVTAPAPSPNMPVNEIDTPPR
jgi:hypothetical protein